ncbi:MAG: hypothetical protein AAFQ32_04725 [Pseudomonadota bacterium]
MPILIALFLGGLALAIFAQKAVRIAGIVLCIAVVGLVFLFLGMSPNEARLLNN